jgi:carbon-monoxide dehydrogenase large subunit
LKKRPCNVFVSFPSKQRLINQRLIPTALEPRAVLAQYTPATQELVLFTSTQAPHLIRRLQ